MTTLIRRLEDWVSQHKKAHHVGIVLTLAVFGLLPGATVFTIYSAIEQQHIPLTVLQHAAFLCGGATLLVFGLLLGVIAGYIVFAVDTLCFPEKGQ